MDTFKMAVNECVRQEIYNVEREVINVTVFITIHILN